MTTTITGETTAEGLAERMFGSVLGALDVFGVYLGDRLGYYRAMATHEAVTAAELAELCGATERYAREWLEHQTISGIVTTDDVTAPAAARRYHLPNGHAEALTDEVSLAYVAPFARMITAAGFKLPAIVDAHRHGGGVAWGEYGTDMRESQGDMNRPFFVNLLGTEWFPKVVELDRILRGPARVADIGCGYGWSSIALAQAYPEITVDGFDVDGPSIAAATETASAQRLAHRVRFHRRDAGDRGIAGSYDVVTAFECIHDLPDPVATLTTMRRLAADDGYVVVMDEKVGHEFGAVGDAIEQLMYGFSNLICLPDGLSHEGSVGTGTVMRPETLEGYARQAGFDHLEVLPVETDLWRFYRLV